MTVTVIGVYDRTKENFIGDEASVLSSLKQKFDWTLACNTVADAVRRLNSGTSFRASIQPV
ncbi:MAG: hypothetical protein H0U23_04695 [Blastocatellia bacterium]|nr:hypothetical protein [Blastocatellia bacterium]